MKRSNSRGSSLTEAQATERAAFFADERQRLSLRAQDLAEAWNLEPELLKDKSVSESLSTRFGKKAGARQETVANNELVDLIFATVAAKKGMAPPDRKMLELSYPEYRFEGGGDSASTDPAASPATPTVAATEDGNSDSQLRPRTADTRGRRRLVGILITFLTLAVAISLSSASRNSGDQTDTGGRPARKTTPSGTADGRQACAIAVGETLKPLTPDETNRLRDSTVALDSLAPPGACPSSAVEHFEKALIQPLIADDEPSGVLMLAPTGESTYLSEALWNSYRQVIHRDVPEAVTAFAGYPLRVDVGDNGAVVEMTDGLLVGVNAETQAFWIPSEALGQWEGSGGVDGSIGRPMTNPYIDRSTGAYHQDYEKGWAHVAKRAPERGPIEFIVVEDRGRLLKSYGDVRGRVLVQRMANTTWYVDPSGKRRWIPTGGVYECIGAVDLELGEPLPGYEIATLPIGPPMDCPEA